MTGHARLAALAAVIVASACGRLDFAEPTARCELRLDRIDPGEPLADFPLPVVLDDTRINRGLLRSDASDLHFLASDGTPLAYEIEDVGARGGPPLVAWVRMPEIVGTSTVLELAYGGAAATSPDTVWTTGYEGVWHMAGSGALADATTHGRDGVVTGTTAIVGAIGIARAFDSAEHDAVVVPGLAGVPTPVITASAWLLYHVQPGAGFYAAITREDGSDGADDFILGAYGQSALAGVDTTSGSTPGVFGPDVGVEEWHHDAMVFDGSNVTLYVDGTASGAAPATGEVKLSPGPVYIGCDRDNVAGTTPAGQPDNDYVDGYLDEVRLESVVRDAAWIGYDVAAMRDQVISYGPTVLGGH